MKRHWLLWLAPAILWGVATVRASTHVEPQPLLAAEDVARVQGIARKEAEMRRTSRRQFPYDTWSQDDAFHNREHRELRAAAGETASDIGSVFSALDTFERNSAQPERRNTAAPCKPRPFYD